MGKGELSAKALMPGLNASFQVRFACLRSGASLPAGDPLLAGVLATIRSEIEGVAFIFGRRHMPSNFSSFKCDQVDFYPIPANIMRGERKIALGSKPFNNDTDKFFAGKFSRNIIPP